MSIDLNSIPLVQARWYTKGRIKPIQLIVIHDMEAPETSKTAENTAQMFKTTTRQASTHYNIDNDTIVRSVNDADTAWAAPGANANGLQLEHAGYASQRIEDWNDGYSTAELALSAQLTAALCAKYGLPIEFVDVKGLQAGHKGITTHVAVSQAFHQSDHTDPGPNFPMEQYLAAVRGESTFQPAPLLPAQTGGGLLASNAPVVSIMTHPTWKGYVEIGADGGVFNFEAPFFGSLGGQHLNQPIVAGAPTQSGQGYWLVAADGGVFGFGDAKFYGSTGNVQLAKPIVDIAVSDTGAGYGLVAEDGGVFAFGDFEFFGRAEYKG